MIRCSHRAAENSLSSVAYGAELKDGTSLSLELKAAGVW